MAHFFTNVLPPGLDLEREYIFLTLHAFYSPTPQVYEFQYGGTTHLNNNPPQALCNIVSLSFTAHYVLSLNLTPTPYTRSLIHLHRKRTPL